MNVDMWKNITAEVALIIFAYVLLSFLLWKFGKFMDSLQQSMDRLNGTLRFHQKLLRNHMHHLEIGQRILLKELRELKAAWGGNKVCYTEDQDEKTKMSENTNSMD